MFQAAPHDYLVPTDGSFNLNSVTTAPPKEALKKGKLKKQLKSAVERIAELQRVLYADDRYGVLLVFQAMDAAGKDSTIRTVLSGVNPAGCQVFAFKRPSSEELDHDFLWRSAQRLPERGRIGVFNRSYYEEALAVRVHPKFLGAQKLPEFKAPDKAFWKERFDSIRSHERHLAANGYMVLKFWLNVSKDEQKKRFLARLDEPEKNWKFNANDVAERKHWRQYMESYESLLKKTSKSWAPWYAIPADDKPFMRKTVADIIVKNMERLSMRYPEVPEKERARFDEMRRILENED